MRPDYLASLLVLGMTVFPAQVKAAETQVVGCINRLPNGTLQLGAIPSGESYVLNGLTNLLERHVGQLVRITGRTEGSGAQGAVVS